MNFHFEFFSKNISNKQFTYKDVDISLFQRPVPRTTTLDNQKKKKIQKFIGIQHINCASLAHRSALQIQTIFSLFLETKTIKMKERKKKVERV